MTDELTIVSGVGGDLDYQGSEDPRWSEPQCLVWSDVYQMVLPLEPGQTLLAPDQRSATLDEVETVYNPHEYQRILQGTDETSDDPNYCVVDAIYRVPCEEPNTLEELPLEMQITPEEMDVLGPWLMLDEDSVCDASENVLDVNFSDGVDHIYETDFYWNDLDSVTKLYILLENFRQVKAGDVENPRGWPTDFDDARLEQLIALSEARSKELYENSFHEKGKWEEFVDTLPVGAAFAVGGVGLGVVTGATYVGWTYVKPWILKRLAAAGIIAVADGPEPFVGDVVAGIFIVASLGELAWNYDTIIAEARAAELNIPVDPIESAEPEFDDDSVRDTDDCEEDGIDGEFCEP